MSMVNTAPGKISVRNLNFYYGKFHALKNINLDITKNQVTAFIGPSGCGKSTLLRTFNKMFELYPEQRAEGEILLDGDNILTNTQDIALLRAKVGMVFQKPTPFPMSIYDNIAFGVRLFEKLSRADMDERVQWALTKAALWNETKDKLHQSGYSLSGGQQQRIAIARAIVNEPKVLLLDEPLGALDLKLRQNMQYELIRLKEELGITFVYVTHDQEEALTMSDTIVVMNQGYIQQIGTPENIYNEPENAFVADFIGHSNIIDGTMIKDELVEILGARWACVDKGFGNNKPVDVVIRPEDVELVDPSEGTLQGEVTSLIFKGVHYELDVMAGGYEWLVHTTRFVPVGTKVGIKVIPFNIQIMHKPESSDEKAVEIDA